MMFEQFSTAGPGVSSSGGYTCFQCEMWVPAGAFHSHYDYPYWGNWLPPLQTDHERLLRLLERIAVALEKIASGSL